MSALIIDNQVKEQLKALIVLAESNPVDIRKLMDQLKTVEGKRHHMAQMTRQTIGIPVGFMVTYSIERGQPAFGDCRHMSMSSPRKDRVPNPQAMWMVAEELGFWGSLKDCIMWPEDLEGHGKAINLVQSVTKPEHQ